MRWLLYFWGVVLAVVVIGSIVRRLFGKSSLDRRVESEEASVLAARSGHLGQFRLGESRQINAEEFMKEIESSPAVEGTSISILIPGSYMPLERGELFEGPLQEALGDLGMVTGGGSFMKDVGGQKQIVEVDVHLLVCDVELALPVIRKTLKLKGAPKGTTITVHTEPEQVHTFD